MKILGLDISSSKIGIALLDKEEIVISEVLKFKSNMSLEERAEIFEQRMREINEQHVVYDVFVEQPAMMFKGGKKRFGLSDAEAAKKVLAYADDMKGKTRMGGGTERALNDLRAMLMEDKPKDEKPKNTDRPKEVREDQERFEETRLDKPENQMPRLEDAYAPTENAYDSGFNKATDANMAAIRGGDDLNEWYQTKFVPHLEADAMATTSEIGDDSRYFLSKFAFEPPELGNVKDLFDKYKDEIEDLD